VGKPNHCWDAGKTKELLGCAGNEANARMQGNQAIALVRGKSNHCWQAGKSKPLLG